MRLGFYKTVEIKVLDFRGLLRRAGPLCLAFLMVACASQDSAPPLGYDEARAERLFSIGYQDVSDIFIEEVSVSQLAIAGMGSLASIDPAIGVEQDDNLLRVSVDGTSMASYPMPDPNDAKAWGALTAATISASRYHSNDLDSAEPEQLYEAVFDGVLSQLDSFSRYAGREAARENRASRDGFGGIGIRIRLIEEGVLVLSVMEDTPAERAGLTDDDVITSIDGAGVEGLSQREVVRRLRGPVRTKVNLKIDREAGKTPISVAVVRAHIVPQTASYHREGNLAHIRLSGFNQRTTDSLKQKIKQAQNEIGDELEGFILDLRGNPGGLLDQAVEVSKLFITDGRIVSTHGRHPDSHQYFSASREDLTKGIPMVVLIDGGSASASEIVAAALQDSGRAVVVGSSSFGKGTVQTVLRLPNQGELTLTWARFHAPSGYALHRRGVLPDICTTGDVTAAEDVLSLIRSGALPLAGDLRRRDIDTNDDQAVESLRANCPTREEEAEIDLQVATRLLHDPGLFARALQGVPNTAEAKVGLLRSSGG
ncbi:S41 family peptidase [Pelagibius litoralis]|uniref:S41 family peptidase n=1 Tax=Pelagibius litoralis TaxID=374515 RepID=A0A967KBA2_9PROT|nr:S41 family peptidase [Pelagibius litoralis]NIA70259.1 S41 family peptidase [Pelagibius litoralis]